MTAAVAALTLAVVSMAAMGSHPVAAVAALLVAVALALATTARAHPLGPLPARAAGYARRHIPPSRGPRWFIADISEMSVKREGRGRAGERRDARRTGARRDADRTAAGRAPDGDRRARPASHAGGQPPSDGYTWTGRTTDSPTGRYTWTGYTTDGPTGRYTWTGYTTDGPTGRYTRTGHDTDSPAGAHTWTADTTDRPDNPASGHSPPPDASAPPDAPITGHAWAGRTADPATRPAHDWRAGLINRNPPARRPSIWATPRTPPPPKPDPPTGPEGIGILHDPDGWLAVIEVDAPAWLPVPDPAALTTRITTEDDPYGRAETTGDRTRTPRIGLLSLIVARRRRLFVTVRITPTLVVTTGTAPEPTLRSALAYTTRALRAAHRVLDPPALAAALDTARGGPGPVTESWDHLRIGTTWQTTVHTPTRAVPDDLIARLATSADGLAFAVDHHADTTAVRCLAPSPIALVTAVALVRDAVGGRVTGSGGAQPAGLRRTLPLAVRPRRRPY